MVAEKIEVYSKSSKPGSTGFLWTSDGSGTYTIQVQGDQLNIAGCFCYLVKRDMSSVHVYCVQYCTLDSLFVQGTRKTGPCLSGQDVVKRNLLRIRDIRLLDQDLNHINNTDFKNMGKFQFSLFI